MSVENGYYDRLHGATRMLVIVAVILAFFSTDVFAQSNDPASRLFQARSIRCEWGPGTQGVWKDGAPSLERATFAKDATVTYDAIDADKGAGRVIGNAGAYDIVVLQTSVGLTFIEQGQEPLEGITFATVFTRTAGRDTSTASERAQGRVSGASYIAVMSRHLNLLGTIAPSQWHGTCRILQ